MKTRSNHIWQFFTIIMKSFLTNSVSKFRLYPSLLHLSLASIIFSGSLLRQWILKKPVIFEFIICVSFCTKL